MLPLFSGSKRDRVAELVHTPLQYPQFLGVEYFAYTLEIHQVIKLQRNLFLNSRCFYSGKIGLDFLSLIKK